MEFKSGPFMMTGIFTLERGRLLGDSFGLWHTAEWDVGIHCQTKDTTICDTATARSGSIGPQVLCWNLADPRQGGL